MVSPLRTWSPYKQLWQIERVNRQLKHTVDIRPVFHRLEDRIRAHVLLCWLALLLIRVAENEKQCAWHQTKLLLSTLELGSPAPNPVRSARPTG